MNRIVTPEELEQAREAWQLAQDKARFEHEAWSILIGSKSSLIKSLNLSGKTISQAQKEFQDHMDGHSERYIAALDDLALRSKEFGSIYRVYKAQNV